jgi:cobalt-zinc-cadmium efflux system protein
VGHDHDHDHDHGHHGHHHGPALTGDPDTDRAVRRALIGALVLNGVFLFIEAGVGWWTNSLALLSDAVHMLGDVGALVLALGAAQVATMRATHRSSFGYRRAEPLGAFVNGLAMLLAVGWIVYEAIERLVEGVPEVAGLPILIVGSIGLAINLGSAWFLARSDRDNLNVRGALLHMLSDALGSVGAIIAAIMVMTGIGAADVVVSLLIALLVLAATWSLLRDSAAVLLEFAPRGLDCQKVLESISGSPGVIDVHDLHVWSLDGKKPLLSAHVRVDCDSERDAVCTQLTNLLAEQYGIRHVTLQVEKDENCPGGGC